MNPHFTHVNHVALESAALEAAAYSDATLAVALVLGLVAYLIRSLLK